MFQCSSLKTLHCNRTLKLGKRKIERNISNLRSTTGIVSNEPRLASSKNECDNCARLVTSITEKLVLSNRERKFKLLTLVPNDWPVQKTCEFFWVSEYAVRQARNLRAEKGILASPQNYSRDGLSSETKQFITKLYEKDEVSRLLSGKKDCISVKLTDGSKTGVQKRLLLSDVSEICIHFKDENANVSVGFSTFATLRPKCCVTVSASGSHSLCVCTYHQNVELMLSAVNPALDCKYVLSFFVCDICNQTCMLHHCDDCPSETDVKRFLREQLLQWASTNRSQLEDKEVLFDDVIEKLVKYCTI